MSKITGSGVFDRYLQEKDLDKWDGFPDLMWSLGFVMDCCHSFEEYQSTCGLSVKQAHTERKRKRNVLYVLEHANRQIVGNFLFSEWRYFTHWAYEYTDYDVDFLHRIIVILKMKFESK